jgi:hypothetical protein
MARNSRISEVYRRRLRLSSRDVLVATVVSALAGIAILTAVWKTDAPGPHTAGPVEVETSP